MQFLILGLRYVSVQYFINAIKEKLSKPINLNFIIILFSSYTMYKIHGITEKNRTKLLNPNTIFGKNLETPLRTDGQMPMDFKIHLLCLVT